jgi:ADP-ribose pyrophosphatase YjhB (NUDIX family)
MASESGKMNQVIYATVCYLRNVGKTLFLDRQGGSGDIHDKKSVPPGGKNEPGERSIDCIKREFPEETGYVLENPRLRMVVTFNNQGRNMGGAKDRPDWVVSIYEATKYSGTLRAERPTAQPRWVADEDIPNLPMHEGDRKIIELLAQEGIYEVLVQYEGDRLKSFEYTRVD